MHARTIPMWLFGSLLHSGLFAQSSQGQDPLAAEMTALLLEQVKGDAAAAETEVSRALSELSKASAAVQAKERPRLLLRRVLLRERLGRTAEARSDLGLLAREPAPFGPWAAARIGEGPETAKTARTVDPSAPLVRLVTALDQAETHAMVNQARQELTRLGPLAVPALLSQLDTLELFGLRNALDLLAVYPDMGVVPALERLLADANQPVRQLTAAQALVKLPPATRKPLAIRLLDGAQGTWLRLAALAAVADDPAERNRLTAECARMGGSDSRAQGRLMQLLAQYPQPGQAEVLRFLEAHAAGSDDDVARAALTAYALHLGDDGEATALALLDRIPKDWRVRGFFDGLRQRRGPVWPRARVRELSSFPENQSSKIKALRADGIEPTAQELAGLLELQPAQEQWCREARFYALTALTTRKDKAGVPAAIRLLSTEEDPYPVILYLAAGAPEELERRIGPLVVRAQTPQVTSTLVRFARDRGVPGAVGPVLERLVGENYELHPHSADALEIVAQHSTPEHLPHVLDLARTRSPGTYVRAACTALTRWFNPACVGPSLERLATLARDARRLVASMASQLATEADVPALHAALEQALRGRPDNERLDVVSFLIAGLGRTGGPKTVPILEGLLRNDDPAVQAAAWRTLRSNSAVDRKAVLARVLKGKESIPFLPVLLDEPIVAEDETLRRSALERLRESDLSEGEELERFFGRLPATERIALATEILDATNQGPGSMGRLVFRALTTLGEMRDETLLPLMARCLRHRDGGVRNWAITQIGNTFSPKALPLLLEGMKDEVEQNAALAVKYIERIGKYAEQKKQIEGALEKAGK